MPSPRRRRSTARRWRRRRAAFASAWWSARATCRPSGGSPRSSSPAWERGDYARCTRCSRRTTQARSSVSALRARLPRGGRHRDAREARGGPCLEPGDGTVDRAGRRPARGSSATIHRRSRCRSARTPTATRRSTGAPELVFPGLRRGEKLTPRDAPADARDDRGPRRHGDRQGRRPPVRPRAGWPPRSPARSAPRRPSARPELAARGVPAGASVGLTGLEREFDARADRHARRRRCSPGERVLAASGAAAGHERAHDDRPRRPARGGRRRWPAATAASPSSARAPARCSALAGIAFSAPAAARLDVQDHHAGRRRSRPRRVKALETFPVQTEATLTGVELQNANGESCGGSLTRLLRRVLQLGVRAAGRQGRRAHSSSPPPSASASTRTRGSPARRARRSPPANEIGDDLAVGSTAIGQGKVLATPLQMALVAAAIGERRRARRADAAQGRRPPQSTRAAPASVAAVRRALRCARS